MRCERWDVVQYSVFECVVDERAYTQMQQAVRRIIKPRLDHVRYYVLCAARRAHRDYCGEVEQSSDGQAVVV